MEMPRPQAVIREIIIPIKIGKRDGGEITIGIRMMKMMIVMIIIMMIFNKHLTILRILRISRIQILILLCHQ
jgi:hypothetical protein